MADQREHVMTVTGVGSAQVVPDGAVCGFSVEVTDRNPATAHRQVGEVVDQVVAALEEIGIAETDRQTTGVALMPRTEFDGTDHVLSGYAASHALRLRIVGMSTISQVLDLLVDTAGDALRLSHHAFTLASSGAGDARKRAEAAALADARCGSSGPGTANSYPRGSAPTVLMNSPR